MRTSASGRDALLAVNAEPIVGSNHGVDACFGDGDNGGGRICLDADEGCDSGTGASSVGIVRR